MRTILGLCIAAGFLSCSPVVAATITRTYDFTFHDYSPTAPVDPVVGSFTVTFDPTVAVTDATAGLVVNSLNLPVAGHFAYDFTPFGEFVFGAVLGADGAGSAVSGTDDFEMGFFHPLDVPIAPSSFYTRAGVTSAFFAGAGSVTAIDGRPGVPEPSAWALMLLGFAAAGAALRRNARLLAA